MMLSEYGSTLCTHRPLLLPAERVSDVSGLFACDRPRLPKDAKLKGPGHFRDRYIS